MRNKSIFILACILLISISTYSQRVLLPDNKTSNPIEIIEQSAGSITINVKCSNIYLKEKEVENTVYNIISMKNFGKYDVTGNPLLPFHGLKLATDQNPDISVEILEEKSELINDILVYPSEEPPFAAEYIKQNDRFRKSDKVYNSNTLYPSSPVQVIETVDYHGIPITTVGIVPIQHNPVSKEIKVYKDLKIKITYNALNNSSVINKNALKTVKNSVINPQSINASRVRSLSDFEDDIIIITTPTFKAAAETLAVWQKMKGYDVKIVSKSSWTTSQVDTEVKNFYNNATVKPGYLLIIGDHDDVPAEMVTSLFIGYGEDTHATDNNYVCMGGSSDYLAEMARGRIAVSSNSEALTVINKIIKYETEPPTKSSFYTNALACGFFQSYQAGYGNDENGDPTKADRRFAQTAEEILNYLDTNFNINSDRIYCAESNVNPLYWNDGNYSWGEPVPDHLRRPTFAWDGDYTDIANGLNDGRFLMYHYDHGYESGWGDPAFSSNQVKSLLSNGDMLPLVYSIDCLVGKFNWYQDCFAEIITKKSDGGAIGIVAATTLSSSGNNEALLDGMIDAAWPGLVLKTPTNSNPTVTEHDPIYNMGDIMNQGFVRMGETWPYYNSYHNTMYHFFGDPTTPLWTEVPQDISKTSDDFIPLNAVTYKISNLNISEGIATLYDAENDTIIGKAEISGSSVEIPITCSPKFIGDMITLTIVSHNYIPSIRKIEVTEETDISTVSSFQMKSGMKLNGNNLSLKIMANTKASLAIFDLKGRAVYKWQNSNNSSKVQELNLNLNKANISNGLYLIKGIIGNKVIEQRLNLVK